MKMKMSVDELQQQVVDIEAAVRELEWMRVDAVASVINALMASGLPKIKAADIAGSAAQRRAHWAQLCHRMSETYPRDLRFPNLDLFVYRVALGAPDPVQAVLLAVDEQWSAKDLRCWIDAQVGKEPRTSIRIAGSMTWNGGDVVITPEEYDSLVLGEGLEDVPVRAVITTKQ